MSERTLEERVAHILRAKQRLFDDLVDDVSVDPDARVGAGLTEAELFGVGVG